jgi:hypothetical protein
MRCARGAAGRCGGEGGRLAEADEEAHREEALDSSSSSSSSSSGRGRAGEREERRTWRRAAAMREGGLRQSCTTARTRPLPLRLRQPSGGATLVRDGWRALLPQSEERLSESDRNRGGEKGREIKEREGRGRGWGEGGAEREGGDGATDRVSVAGAESEVMFSVRAMSRCAARLSALAARALPSHQHPHHHLQARARMRQVHGGDEGAQGREGSAGWQARKCCRSWGRRRRPRRSGLRRTRGASENGCASRGARQGERAGCAIPV